jgi:large subunit ribosomal protein L25
MERATLNAEFRDKAGKGVARSLRRDGSVPAVIYKAGESSPIKLDTKETLRLIRTTFGDQIVINLKFTGGDSRLVLLKEYQTDPLKGDLLHVDFQEISLTEKVKVTVHVSTVGEPIGVKRDGGILQQALREIEIECLPDKIPGLVEVDVSELLTGHSLHVSDIALSEDVKVLTDASEVVATVMIPSVMVEEEAAPEEALAEEEEAAPEVIKKGKKEEEEKAAPEEKKEEA